MVIINSILTSWKVTLLFMIILMAVFTNMRAIVGPFLEPKLNVTIHLADCDSSYKNDCILKGSTHYEFFTNDTFVTDSKGVVSRLSPEKIAARVLMFNENN